MRIGTGTRGSHVAAFFALLHLAVSTWSGSLPEIGVFLNRTLRVLPGEGGRGKIPRLMKRYLLWFDVAIYLIIAAFVFGLRPRTTQYWIGLVTFLFGLVFWVMARVQLGQSFAITAQAKKLVTHGLYSKITHPIYFFAGFALLGILIAGQNWIALAVGVIFYSMQLGRVRRENLVLEQAFGDEYRQYRAKTWF